MTVSRKLACASALVLAAAFAAPAMAAPAANPTVAAKMNGYWRGWNTGPRQPESVGNTPKDKSRYPPALLAVLKPWVKAGLAKYQRAAETDMEPPTPDNNCLPFAMPGERASYAFPIEFQVTPKTTAILFQIDHQLRFVYMNQQHPKNLQPSWLGHSVGHWEGDTLVIDTVGFDTRTDFSDGVLHSPKLHIIETYRLIDNGAHLEGTYTYIDPDAYTAPYTVVRKFQRAEPMQEYVNAENNQLYACPNEDTGTKYRPFH
jgi:hypothetical protein